MEGKDGGGGKGRGEEGGVRGAEGEERKGDGGGRIPVH